MSVENARKPCILVVDDSEQNRALATATLEDQGYEILLANSGAEALQTFEARAPDCVLMDVRMPGMDGLEACRKIRTLPGGSETPIVFLTALRDLDTFDAALRAGADDFLTKPVRPTELILRVQAAVRLRRLNATNREYVDLVRRQRDDLMRLQLQKERLMAFVVHDLKNPVSTIDLHAQLLLRDKELPQRTRDAAACIRDEVRSLMRLILNLLDLSKGEEGRLEVKRTTFDLEQLALGIVDAMHVRAKAKNIAVECNVPALSVQADVDLLRRIVENLLENALRHAPDDSTVTISAASNDSTVDIRIADRGSGVPTEMRESIFERFVRLEGDNNSATRSGRGLGLSFCRLAVEAHGGKIWIEDGAPGAVFCVRLPHVE